jgi:molecular chaperone DnaJ
VVKRELKVDVPAGIADGQRIRVSGRGHVGEPGAPAGDLYVLVHVREDERFVRDGDDLVTVLDVPAPAAALGATLPVPSLDGALDVEVPAGTQPGEVIALRGKGMPALRRGRTGDLRVVVNVVVPRRLSAEQRELVERLAGTMTPENLRGEESVFQRLRRALRTSA